jgi:hypothetical protein
METTTEQSTSIKDHDPQVEDYEQQVEALQKRLFESDEFATTRSMLEWVPPNSGTEEDIATLMKRVDEYAPAIDEWLDAYDKRESFNAADE